MLDRLSSPIVFRHIFSTVLFLIFNAFLIQAQKDQLKTDPDLVLYYDFEDIVDSVVHDQSANALNGIRYNTSVTAGKEGNALAYNDSTSFIYLGKDARLNMPQFTLMAWVKPYSRGSDKQRMEILEKTDSYWFNLRNGNTPKLLEERGKMRVGGFFKATEASEKQWIYLDTKSIIEPQVWTHTIFTYDNIKMSAYLNGVPDASMNVPPILHHSFFPASIGCKISKDSVFEARFHGIIDEFFMLSRALTQVEIDNYLGIMSDVDGVRSPIAGRIYPNPATDYIIFEPSNLGENTEVMIFDLQGRIRYRQHYQNISSTHIELKDFSSGVYILKTVDAKGVHAQLFEVKNKQ
jgi:hypothetical protein